MDEWLLLRRELVHAWNCHLFSRLMAVQMPDRPVSQVMCEIQTSIFFCLSPGIECHRTTSLILPHASSLMQCCINVLPVTMALVTGSLSYTQVHKHCSMQDRCHQRL